MNADTSVDVRALDGIRHALEIAENAGDAEAIAAHLGDDAVFMVPHVPAQEGKEACVSLLRGVLADLAAHFNRRIAYVSAEIHVRDDFAFDRGTFSVDIAKKDGRDASQFSGKYFWTYQRDAAGPWKLARAIVSLDQESEAPSGHEAIKAPERIETARLVLRRPREEDAGAIFSRFASDPEVVPYMAWPRHASLADTHKFIEFSDCEWDRSPAGPYVIESRETGQVLGCTGLGFEHTWLASTGYVLAEDSWGRGFATEALAAMVEVARAHGVIRLYATVHTAHRASARVLEKSGFSCEGVLRRHTIFPNLAPDSPLDVLMYARVLA